MNPDILLSAGEAKEQFAEIIRQMQSVVLEQMKTPAGRETLRRDLCAMQGRPLGPCFEGETEDNWRPK